MKIFTVTIKEKGKEERIFSPKSLVMALAAAKTIKPGQVASIYFGKKAVYGHLSVKNGRIVNYPGSYYSEPRLYKRYIVRYGDSIRVNENWSNIYDHWADMLDTNAAEFAHGLEYLSYDEAVELIDDREYRERRAYYRSMKTGV